MQQAARKNNDGPSDWKTTCSSTAAGLLATGKFAADCAWCHKQRTIRAARFALLFLRCHTPLVLLMRILFCLPLTHSLSRSKNCPIENGCMIGHMGAYLWTHSQSDVLAEASLFTHTDPPLVEHMIPSQIRLLSYRKSFRHVYNRGEWNVQQPTARCVHLFMKTHFPSQ
jgi:hypothetical protein